MRSSCLSVALSKRAEVVNEFLARFQLSEEETAAIHTQPLERDGGQQCVTPAPQHWCIIGMCLTPGMVRVARLQVFRCVAAGGVDSSGVPETPQRWEPQRWVRRHCQGHTHSQPRIRSRHCRMPAHNPNPTLAVALRCCDAARVCSVRLEIYESMARHQQVAHERLYLWVQQKCPDVDSEMPDTQTSVLLRRALLVLRQRPAYYKCVARVIVPSCSPLVWLEGERGCVTVGARLTSLCRVALPGIVKTS